MLYVLSVISQLLTPFQLPYLLLYLNPTVSAAQANPSGFGWSQLWRKRLFIYLFIYLLCLYLLEMDCFILKVIKICL